MSPFFIVATAAAAVSPMQSVAKRDRALDHVGDRGGDGLQRIGLVRPALGAAEMGEQDDLAALVGDLDDRRGDALDARRIGHPAVFGGNVEVDAQQDALAGDIGVVESAERLLMVAPCTNSGRRILCFSSVGCRAGPRQPIAVVSKAPDQISFASATAVSAMRFEKPHSLSYQDRTRTNVPSMTLVWSRWKTDERSSWLKSIETFGLSV